MVSETISPASSANAPAGAMVVDLTTPQPPPTCKQCYRIDGDDYERLCEPYQEGFHRVTHNAATGETTTEDVPESGCKHECHDEWVDPREVAFA